MNVATRLLASQWMALFLIAAAWGQTPQVPETIRQLMQDRHYAEAVRAIDAASGDKKADQDYLAYLKGRALHLQKRYDEAIAAYRTVAQQHPDSHWARRARFAEGVSHARKGDFRAAELIYRKEAQYLLSADRKQELAEIYLEFADTYFKPPKEEQKPDFKKALEFYSQALLLRPKPDKQREIELQIALCHQKMKQWDKAIGGFRQFITDHLDHPLAVEARFRLGEVQLNKGDPVAARRTWQDLLELQAGSPSPRLPEAAFNLSLTYGIPAPSSLEQLELGVASLRSFVQTYPDHELSSQGYLRIAQSYQHVGRSEDAAALLAQFLADPRYATRPEIPDARFLLGQALKMQRKFDQALAVWKEFLAKHPTHKLWSQAQHEIVNTQFTQADSLYRDKKYAEARKLWDDFLAKYPLDARNRAVLYLFGQMNYDQKQWEPAIADWRRLVSKYPNTNESSQAQFMVASTLEEKLGRLEEALEAYRKLSWGSYQAQAKQRVARLTARSMRIATPRVFRSDEEPYIKLEARNIETVTVRVYQVDLETYFRKMRLARGIEQLDIALIDPDTTFEYKIPEYRPYQQFEQQVKVPLPATGPSSPARVMAVTVTSKTLEATTLLLRSDLDIVIKSSREEVLVFAENMRQGKPWPKVHVIAADGDRLLGEGETNDQGVFRHTWKELKTIKDLRVFAVADGHVASNNLNLKGLAAAKGLADRGYIYTDRPAYRPGQLVHIRGLVRKVADDVFTVPDKKKYHLSVRDNRNRLLHESDVQLNAFGSLHDQFQLPAICAQGEYRILVSDQQLEHYQGSFLVHEYQLEPVQLVIDAPRTVYYRGEEISGTIKAAYYYGAPLAAREVRYALQGGRTFTATTDEKGEVEFSFPTRDYNETQPLTLAVELAERNLRAGKVFFLATQAFTLSATTVRDVYLAGETFEVEVNATSAEDKPVATELELRVLKRTKVARRTGEVLVAKHTLKTDQQGRARKTLQLKEGGSYLVRVEGVDRFKNPVSTETRLTISDDKDRVRLRILADQHTYRVGDTAHLRIHWREKPALALVTHQGARILHYHLLQLKTGINQLDVPITARLAPNFELALAVMTDSREPPNPEQPAARLHLASSPFTVERELAVTLECSDGATPQTPRTPGEKVEVTIKTADPQGRPVSAELSLAMIEQSLLDRFQPNRVKISDFFRGARRAPAVRTNSSITFSYRPHTKPINKRLLAEADRRAVEEEETRRLAALRDGDQDANGVLLGGARLTADILSDRSGLVPNRHAATGDSPTGGEQANNGQAGGVEFGTGGQWGGYGGMGGYPGANSQSQMGGARRGGGRFGRQRSQQSLESFDAFAVPRGQGQGDVQRAQSLGVVRLHGADAADVKLAVESILAAPQAQTDFETNLSLAVSQKQEMNYQILTQDGRSFNLQVTPQEHQTVLRQLRDTGAILLPLARPNETGYWNPSVTTDERGTAKVTLAVPARSTAWKLMAKGITVDTLAGEADTPLVAKKTLFGQLKLPLAITDGDDVQVLATVHNEALEKGSIQVTLKTSIGEKSHTERKTLTVEKKGIQEIAFAQKISLSEVASRTGVTDAKVEFTLTVEAGDRRDVAQREVPIRPYGMPVYAIQGGSADSDALAVVAPPENMTLQAAELQIVVGPTIERSLLDVVLGTPTWCQIQASRASAGADRTTSDLMAAVALQQLIRGTRDADNPQSVTLDRKIRSAISLLVATQNDDGGWSWSGRTATSDPYLTARTVWALSLARRSGYSVARDGFEKAKNLLRTALVKSAVSDYETKCVLVHALAVAGGPDFPLANQLYRNRQRLSPAALAHLALAFVEMDHKQTSGELLSVLGKRDLDRPAPRAQWLACNQSPTELHALYAVAIQQTVPSDSRLAEQVDWLLAHRTGHRWNPDKATGPAMLALCRWQAVSRHEEENYQLTVFVNDKQVRQLAIDKNAVTQTIQVPRELLADGKQQVRFHLAGRGRYTYQCVLGGFVPSDKLKSTTADWTVERYYEPANLEMDGKTIPRGFNILQGSYQSFRNKLGQLPVGRRGHVRLVVRRHNIPANTPNERLEYLVVTEPLPSGATVVEGSVKGRFERYEITPGAIQFYLRPESASASIDYEIHGYLTGRYRTTSTLVRNAYRIDQIAVAPPGALQILPRGAKSEDPYRLSPLELYELGKRYYDKHNYVLAAKHLGDLMGHWNLKSDVFKETTRMLLDVHLEKGPPAEVVRYFEIIIEKYPDLEIPFADLLKVGDAYHQIGEYERSYLVFRAVVEASFMRESRIAGFLQQRQEFLRSVDVMSTLLREYPPEPYVAAASYALAQQVYAKAADAAKDEKLRKRKITRVDLIRQAWAMLDNFLAAHPDDPAADEASFSLANAILELELYEETIARCTQFAKRFPDSRYLDSFWYIIGYCQYARGDHKSALEMCQKVAKAKRIDKTTGRTVESQNKWRAIYIMGQIYHSLGQAAQAITEYRRVAERFTDARQAIEYFTRKEMKLPEVVTVRPGKPARVKLQFRNVAKCRTTIYRIDLMKFSLLRRNLSGITNINLAGIRPFYEAEVVLGDGKDYRDREKELDLPLKREGAYLVVCRGLDLYTSGMILVSPLALDVLEDAQSGRVRSTVRDVDKDAYVGHAHVKVIGSRNEDFVSGETDLRGIFVADAIQGQSMVIAQADDGRYAFYRGQQELGPPARKENKAGKEGQAASQAATRGGKGDLLQGLKSGNRGIQMKNQKQLEELYENEVQEGIGGGFGGGMF